MDISHNFGADFTLSNSGDLQMVAGSAYGQQRVLRRLLTNPGAYVWHGNYGGGMAGFVGRTAKQARIVAVALKQMRLESRVAQNPPPSVTVNVGTNGVVSAAIGYTDAPTNTPQAVVT